MWRVGIFDPVQFKGLDPALDLLNMVLGDVGNAVIEEWVEDGYVSM